MLTRNEFSELFEIRMRGVLARAFGERGRQPSDEQWQMMRGERKITIHDLAVVAHETNFQVGFYTVPRDMPQANAVETDD